MPMRQLSIQVKSCKKNQSIEYTFKTVYLFAFSKSKRLWVISLCVHPNKNNVTPFDGFLLFGTIYQS